MYGTARALHVHWGRDFSRHVAFLPPVAPAMRADRRGKQRRRRAIHQWSLLLLRPGRLLHQLLAASNAPVFSHSPEQPSAPGPGMIEWGPALWQLDHGWGWRGIGGRMDYR